MELERLNKDGSKVPMDQPKDKRVKKLVKKGNRIGEMMQIYICAMVKSRYIGDGHPTFNRNPYNGYINPYYWVDDHPLLYGNNGSLDPGTHIYIYM